MPGPRAGQRSVRRSRHRDWRGPRASLRDVRPAGGWCHYALALDKWGGPILVSAEERKAQAAEVPVQVKGNIAFAAEQIRTFALAQKDSVKDFSMVMPSGLTVGQKWVPCNVAGCYVPTGRYAHIASACMSIATAKAAGVKTVVDCSTPYRGGAMHPYVLYAMHAAGADIVMTLGGVQAIAAMALGLFAGLIGRRYAVAVNSCGSSMFLALLDTGIRPGDPVLMNAFTLGPVPGAIAHAGAVAIPVEITEDLVIDLADLRAKAKSSGAKHLLASHMRGHLCDLEALEALESLSADEGITLIEDCAHALGANWDGTPAVAFGRAACFSLQSAKHVNAGEGGVLVTDDADLAVATVSSSDVAGARAPSSPRGDTTATPS